MFVIKQSQSYFWPVEVMFPVSGGKHDKQTFDVEFKRISQSRIKEIGKQIDAGEIADADLCKEIVTGWKGVTDEKSEEMPFSSGALEGLLDIPLVGAAIVTAWFESLSTAKRKN